MDAYINALYAYIPPGRASVVELFKDGLIDEKQRILLSRVYELDCVPVANAGLSALLYEAIKGICAKTKLCDKDISCILYCHTPGGGDENAHAIIKSISNDFGFGSAQLVCLSEHMCAMPIIAFELAQQHLAQRGGKGHVMVLTGELVGNRGILIDKVTVRGEASAACLISNNPKGAKICSVSYTETCDKDQFSSVGGYFGVLSNTVQRALEIASIDRSMISLLLPHNTNVLSWKRFSDLFQISNNKILMSNIRRFGHCLTSDPFINLDTVYSERLVSSSNYVVLTGVGGLGTTIAASVLRL